MVEDTLNSYTNSKKCFVFSLSDIDMLVGTPLIARLEVSQ